MSLMEAAKILFVPNVEEAATSERTPVMLRLLRQRHTVIGLIAPWERTVYDPRRPKAARYVLYVLGQVRAVVRGLRVSRREAVGLVFCETAHHALVGLWIARVRGIPCVWDSHGNALLFARSTLRGRAYTFLSASLDRFLARRVDLLLTVSRKDADAYEAMGAPPSRIQVIPTCVDLSQVDRQIAHMPRARTPPTGVPAKKVLIFFGSFGYGPNVHALEFIADVVAPFLVRSGVPCEIQIAGRDLPARPLHPIVKRVGFVTDLHGWIRQSDLCIVPVWRGVGILTKALDVMAAGTPMVASSLVTDGIPEVRDGVHAVVVPSPEEFPDRVAFALSHPSLMEEMAENARRLIEERYDWRLYGPRLEEMISALTRNPRER